MMRRVFGIFALILFASNWLGAKQPNIIWIMAEDISLDLECYGMKAVQTSNLNRLAEEGIRFDNCFVTNPICSPSRSAMMTGTHQRKINAHHHRSNRNIPLDKQFVPFTKLLRDNGYTCILGHHGVMNRGRKIDCNFKTEPLGEWDGETKFGLFDKYDEFTKADEPFFAQIQLVVTHRGDWWNEVRQQSKHPVDPDKIKLPKFMADHPTIRLDWAKYLDQIEFADQEVGMILKELKDKGLSDNTIVIFIGDNGRCNIRGKGYVHDPGLRIPLIIYDPRAKSSNNICKKVVSATDITATIINYAGIKIPDFMTGQPIFSADFNREYAYGARDLWDEIMEQMSAVTTDRWKYIRNDKVDLPYDAHQAYLEFYRPAVHVMRKLKTEGVLSENEQLFFVSQKPAEELYDLNNDPQELNNLANDPAFLNQLRKMRKVTREYDMQMTPVSDVFEPITTNSVEIIEWVKENRPEKYEEMLQGVELGFKQMTSAYKAEIKQNKK